MNKCQIRATARPMVAYSFLDSQARGGLRGLGHTFHEGELGRDLIVIVTIAPVRGDGRLDDIYRNVPLQG